MNLDTANETDVREEIAMPLLTALGYQWGTANDILRELPLKYDRIFLGRKKNSDPPIRGIPDYVLSVTGAGRWVLEIKAPNVDIRQDQIEQAISYARHPEVSASYAAILNGRRLVVYHITQRSEEDPLLDLSVESPDSVAQQLMATLSPHAIRRDCSPPKVDLGLPLAEGLRSSAEIKSGTIGYSDYQWVSNQQLPPEFASQQDEVRRRMLGFRTDITGGRVWRDSDHRIKATLEWSMPHEELFRFAQDKRLLEVEYVALSQTLSSNPNSPTVFDVVGDVRVEKGEPIFDIVRWDTDFAGAAMRMSYRGQATGYVEGMVFRGDFQAEYECSFPVLPELQISMYVVGHFEVRIDDR